MLLEQRAALLQDLSRVRRCHASQKVAENVRRQLIAEMLQQRFGRFLDFLTGWLRGGVDFAVPHRFSY